MMGVLNVEELKALILLMVSIGFIGHLLWHSVKE